ncbi:MAG: hypothetical protein O2946_03340 [Planctomycetota bacterium]|nr:hypothetical protein [Planctomycetota bacterium]
MPADTDPTAAGSTALTLLFEPVGSWWFVLMVAAGLAAVLVLVGPDRSRVDGFRLKWLVGLRVAAFLAIVLCMLRPTVVAQRRLEREGDLLVLADASESMTVADAPAGQTRWEHLVSSLEAAAPEARELLDEGHLRLHLWRFDRGLEGVPVTADDPFPLDPVWVKQEGSEETALGTALDEAVQTTSFESLAGVIVLSDGAQHAYPPRDLPPQTVARRLGESGIPLWSVLFGQQRSGSQGRDAEIVQLSVADDVFVKTTVEVSGRVRLTGFGDRDVVVRLLVEEPDGVLEEVARTVVRSVGADAEETVRLSWRPEQPGERKLSLVVDPLEGETVITNNEVSSFVNVIDGGLQVVYLEGALRVEQRFLRRTLAASPDMQVAFRWIDSSDRSDWPVDLSDVLTDEVDVFLIGDLDSSAVSPEQLALINDRVGQGAGLGLLGGLHAFEAGGWGSTPLQPALPFERDPLSRQRFDEPIRESLHLRGPLQMLPDERFGGISILRLADTPAENLAAWRELPPLEGANILGPLAAAARPLAVSQAGDPLLVAKNYGTGRVAALAVDSTWRWVMQGEDRAHRRFWRQFIFWLASRDDITDDALWVRPAQRRISAGMPLSFNAGLRQADGEPIEDAVVEAEIVAPDGTKRPVRLVRDGESWAGQLTDCTQPGDWTIAAAAARDGQAVASREARFTVFRQDLEMANPIANGLVMRQLAEETGREPQLAEDIAAIFEELLERPVVYESEAEWNWSLWDSWPMLLVTVGLLSLEWFLRKRWGLA